MRIALTILAASAAAMIVLATILALQGRHALWGTAVAMALLLIGMFFVPIKSSESENKDQSDDKPDT